MGPMPEIYPEEALAAVQTASALTVITCGRITRYDNKDRYPHNARLSSGTLLGSYQAG